MSRKILVRGSEGTGWTTFFRLVSVGVIAAGIVVYLAVQQPVVAAVGVIVGIAILLCNEAAARQDVRHRRWISDTGTGFTITDFGVEKTGRLPGLHPVRAICPCCR